MLLLHEVPKTWHFTPAFTLRKEKRQDTPENNFPVKMRRMKTRIDIYMLMCIKWTSQVNQWIKNPPTVQET